ncbi:protein FAM47E [Perognathus longimembris pacificus]|uniref:protein FAM47E n=1 Tax=Perognathus longimembris pacificus TaxID=214514 RepID=UPI0020195ABA|nr:protein FAM47E [Perognathus longimembris pacificus]
MPAPQDARRRARNKEHPPSKLFTEYDRLNSRRWVFVSEGLDDCRKVGLLYHGLTPAQSPREAFLPQIHHRTPQPAPKKRQHEWPTKAALSSKLSRVPPTPKTRLEGRAGRLAAHPLAVYPHLEEALPAELLLKVLEALDPERKLQETWACCQDARRRAKEPTHLLKKPSTQLQPGLSKKAPVLHSGRWLHEEKPDVVGLLHEDCPHALKSVHEGVRDFCNWATTLGVPDIHEEYVLQQFDLTSESNVLSEMRPRQGPPEPKESKSLGPGSRPDTGCPTPQKSPKAKRAKMRYGAWYLRPSLWRKQRADEPLLDPKVCEARGERLSEEQEKQDELLAHLHGPAAFKDFIIRKGYKMPRFLEKLDVGKKSDSEFDKTPTKLT